MNGAMTLIMILIFTPPVAAVFVLIKRLREERYRNESDARDKFFESISLNNLQTIKNQQPLSADNADNKVDNNIPVDTIKEIVPEDNKRVVPEPEKTHTSRVDLLGKEQNDKKITSRNTDDNENQSRIDKAQAADLVMNMIKTSKKNGNSGADLQNMIELLKSGNEKNR